MIVNALTSEQSWLHVNTLNSEQSGTMSSNYSMEEGDSAIVSDVKIEIDVAEETQHCWHISDPNAHGKANERS